jgi:hypothetical protein
MRRHAIFLAVEVDGKKEVKGLINEPSNMGNISHCGCMGCAMTD